MNEKMTHLFNLMQCIIALLNRSVLVVLELSGNATVVFSLSTPMLRRLVVTRRAE
jgi:hypothetical protein